MPGRRFCRRVTAKGKMCAAGSAIFVSRQNVHRSQCHFPVTARCAPRAVPFSCHGVLAAADSAIFLPRQDVRRGRVAAGHAISVSRQDVHRGQCNFPCHDKMCAARSAIFLSRQNVRCGPQTIRRPVGLCGVPAAERLHSKCLLPQSSSFRHFEPLRGPYYPSRSPYHCENSPKSYKTLVTSQFIAVFMEIKTVSTTKCPEKAINLYKPPNL